MEKEKRAKQMEKEEASRLFKPNISQHSRKMASQRSANQLPTFEELYKAASGIAEKKKLMMEAKLKKREEDEMKDVTFKPKINSNAGRPAFKETADRLIGITDQSDDKRKTGCSKETRGQLSYSQLNKLQKSKMGLNSDIASPGKSSNSATYSSNTNSYLSRHLYKKNYGFNKEREQQERKKDKQ